jgi:hypothetical protein
VCVCSYSGNQKKAKKNQAGTFNIDAILSAGIREVSSVRPVEDFRSMITRRDTDLVEQGKV